MYLLLSKTEMHFHDVCEKKYFGNKQFITILTDIRFFFAEKPKK